MEKSKNEKLPLKKARKRKRQYKTLLLFKYNKDKDIATI